MNLQLPLKKKWFDMTKAGIKLEDYRDINEYWISRLIDFSNYPIESKNDRKGLVKNFYFDLKNGHSFENCLKSYYAKIKTFSYNTMTLGYPKSTDTERVIKFEHAGIEIRSGNPEWGAEPGKIYFVIKHGKQL